MAGVQRLARGLDDLLHRDRGDDDLQLDLRQQHHVNRHAAVVLRRALLLAAARDVSERHAGHADGGHGVLEGLEAGLTGDDDNLVHGCRGVLGNHLGHRHRSGDRSRRGRRFHRHIHGIRRRDEVRIRADQAVLRLVQAHDFLRSGDAQADGLVNNLEDDGHGHDHPGNDSKHAQDLDAQEGEAAAIDEAFLRHLVAVIVREDAGEDGAGRAAQAMYADRADRVVHLHNLVDELDAEHHHEASNDADRRSARRGHHVAAGGDGHQAGQGAVQGHGDVRLAVAHPGDAHDRNGRHGRRQVRGHEDAGRGFVRAAGQGDGRAAVEAEPAEPEDEHAQRAKGQGVARNRARLAVLAVLADARAEDRRADERRNAADHVHGGGAGKVMEAHLRQPAAAPDPVAGDRIDDRGDHHGVDAVRGELGALRHRAGDDGRRRRAEDGLEDQRRPVAARVREQIQAADELAAAAKHDAKADQPEDRGAQAEVHQVFHDDVAGVLGAGEARLHHRKTGLHKEHQRCAQQDPARVQSGFQNSQIHIPYLLMLHMNIQKDVHAGDPACTPLCNPSLFSCPSHQT